MCVFICENGIKSQNFDLNTVGQLVMDHIKSAAARKAFK